MDENPKKPAQAARRSAARIGQPPDAFSRRRENGVGNSRGSRRNAGFVPSAEPPGGCGDVNFDVGRSVAYAQHFIIVKVALLHPAVGNCDFAFESLGQAEIDGAFHLRFHADGIDGRTTIDRADHAINPKSALLCVTGNFRDLRDVTAPAKSGGDATSTAGCKRLVPAGFLRGKLDDGAAAAHIDGLSARGNLPRRSKRGEQKFNGVAADGMRGFIKETGDDELVAGGTYRAPVTEGHVGFGDVEFKPEIWNEESRKVQGFDLGRGLRRNSCAVIKRIDRGRRATVAPGDQLALCVQTGLQDMAGSRSVEIVADVVLA